MNNKLTDDEKSLFAKAVKDVKRLAVKNTVFTQKSAVTLPRRNKLILSQWMEPPLKSPPIIDLHDLAEEHWVSVEEIIKFNRPGLQNKLLKKLAQGKIPIEAQLDLHRFRAAEALLVAEEFLERCHNEQFRLALIIHGKGINSRKPILKNLLNVWLRTQEKVLAFHTARPKEGGTGAVYVIIS